MTVGAGDLLAREYCLPPQSPPSSAHSSATLRMQHQVGKMTDWQNTKKYNREILKMERLNKLCTYPWADLESVHICMGDPRRPLEKVKAEADLKTA